MYPRWLDLVESSHSQSTCSLHGLCVPTVCMADPSSAKPVTLDPDANLILVLTCMCAFLTSTMKNILDEFK